MDTARVGIIGAGAIARSAINGVRNHEQGEIAAVCDLSEPRRTGFAKEHEIPTVYATSTELISDPNIDIVYVALPNRFHAPVSIEALNAGKHVILDKPFALNLAEAEEVVHVAQKKGRRFMLGMNQRFRSDSQKIRSLVEQGVLGEIYHAKAYWYRRSGIPRFGTWFGSKELAGGGCLLDIGVHMLDLALYCMNNFEPARITGHVSTRFGDRGIGEGGWGKSDRDHTIDFDVEDNAFSMIRMRNGATVSMDVTWASHIEEKSSNNVELLGTEGGAKLYPAKVLRNDPLREDYDIIETVKADIPYPEDRFQHFIDVVLGTAEPCVTVEQSLIVQKLIDALYESSRTAREVRFD